MKIAYIDCSSGVSGDMLLGAIVDSGIDIDLLFNELKSLGVEFEMKSKTVYKNHVRATKVDVLWDERHHHHHRHLRDIEGIVSNSSLSKSVKEKSISIFRVVAEAEAKVHGMSVEDVHFHEVGAVDSIVDIVGSVVGFELLGIEKIYTSALNVGSGRVECAHGVLPVPAPATSEILRGMPIYSDGDGELVTPTGAAIVKVLSSGFGGMPSMNLETVSLGAGSRDIATFPNVLRMFLGRVDVAEDYDMDEVLLLETDIDDSTPEMMGFIYDVLIDSGALDVVVIPNFMKKNRVGFRLSVLVSEDKLDFVLRWIFAETTTFGIRVSRVRRYKLFRKEEFVDTIWGSVKVKVGSMGDKVVTVSPEYESCKEIALKGGVPLKEVYGEVMNKLGKKTI